jgi:hypothetical protein
MQDYETRFRPSRVAVRFLAAASLLALGAGCTHRVADLTVVSSKNVDLYPLDLRGGRPQINVRGVDGRWWFFFLPLGGEPNVEEALDDALKNGVGDLMTDAVLYQRFWTVFFMSRGEFIIEGKVWNSGDIARRRPPLQPAPEPSRSRPPTPRERWEERH